MPSLFIKSQHKEVIEIDDFLGTKLLGIEISDSEKKIYAVIAPEDIKQIIIHLTKQLESINESV